MGKMVTLVRQVVAVIGTALKLKGAASSRITRAQWAGQGAAVLVVSAVVAGLALVPGSPLSNPELAVSLVVIVSTWAGPILSRALGYKEKGGEVVLDAGMLDALALALEEKEAREAARAERAESGDAAAELLAWVRKARPEVEKRVAEKRAAREGLATEGTKDT